MCLIPSEHKHILYIWLVTVIVTTSVMTFALLITVFRLICYTELTALTTITALLIISNVGYVSWSYNFAKGNEHWKNVTSWFFASTPLIVSFWILS
jgi:carbonic anhydrase